MYKRKLKPVEVEVKRERKVGRDFSKLKRPRYPMPDFVKQALDEKGLMEAYQKRPAYQQNDYVGWTDRAKRRETKEKRLCQMLEELERGGVYSPSFWFHETLFLHCCA